MMVISDYFWLMLRNCHSNKEELKQSRRSAFLWLYLLKSLLVLLCLTRSCCTAVTALPSANGSLVCWFCLVPIQWFFSSGRMSAPRVWPSLRMLDVILSTWSLHYLLSSTMLPSRCSATWNAWLAHSVKPSRNCVLKCCRLFLFSAPFSHVCSSQEKIPPLGRVLLSQGGKTHKTSFSVCSSPQVSH